MTEYITKEQALYIASYAANSGNLERAQKLLDAAPTADVVEEVRCEWVKSEYGSYICSACGIEWMLDDWTPEVRYCPNCGAILEESR